MVLAFGSKKWFAVVASILLLADIIILLNIPFLRPIIGFLFLTILPGLLILQILKLNKIDFLEKFILTWGLSISFVMLFGLLINNLSLAIGYKMPLSTTPLLFSLNIAFIILATIGVNVNKTPIFSSMPNLNLNTSEKAFLIVPVFFPLLSIFGMRVMNTTANNILLMSLLFLIPIYVAFVCFFNQRFTKRFYPVVIFLISFSLLLMYMLRSHHIYGSDVHLTYYLFQTTLNNLHWSIVIHSTIDACLNISLLPAIYQSIMNVNAQEYLFKGISLSICSFSPLAVYVISKRYIGESYAFVASFFFISQSCFLAGGPRTKIAIFFAALVVMVLLSDKIELFKKKILIIIFMLSIVVSHYSTAYIFFFIILFTWFMVEMFSKRYTVNKKITLTSVLLFFAFIFFWYSQITVVPFNAGVKYFENTFFSLNNFFLYESRYTGCEQLFGRELEYGTPSRINLVATWGSFILIGIGALTMLKKYKEMISISNIVKKPDFLKTKFEVEFLAMVLCCIGILILTIVLPYVSTGYGIDRLYSLVTIVLSTCFVMGGIALSNLFLKQTFKKSSIKNATQTSFKKRGDGKNATQVRAYLIILLVLVPYFLMMTGVTHQICGVPFSITLNSKGMEYDTEYVHDQESCSAKWLKNHAEKKDNLHTTDPQTAEKLISQGNFLPSSIYGWSFFEHRKIRGYLYLGYDNVINKKFSVNKKVYDLSDYADIFMGKNNIYDNGGSEVWR